MRVFAVADWKAGICGKNGFRKHFVICKLDNALDTHTHTPPHTETMRNHSVHDILRNYLVPEILISATSWYHRLNPIQLSRCMHGGWFEAERGWNFGLENLLISFMARWHRRRHASINSFKIVLSICRWCARHCARRPCARFDAQSGPNRIWAWIHFIKSMFRRAREKRSASTISI